MIASIGKSWKLATAIAVIAFGIAGCAVIRDADPAAHEFVLAAPKALGSEVSAFQQLHLERGELNRQYTLALEIGNDTLQLVFMSTIGQRLATWRYSDHHYHLHIEAGAPSDLPYRLVLVATQWLFWPIDALESANSSDWRFSVSGVYYRDVLVAKLTRPAVQPTPWEGKYGVEFPASGTRLRLQSTLQD